MASTSGEARSGGWYHGWNIVAAAVLSQIAANGLAINSMSLFLHSWSTELHAPISKLLLAMLPLAVVSALAAPLVGALADKLSARLLFGLGLAGIAACCIAMSLITEVWQLWALYGVFPLALLLCTSITANAVVSRWFVRRIGLALGVTAFGVGIAGAVLPPIIAQVMPAIGWRGVWLGAGAIIGLVVLPVVLAVVRDRPTERDGLHYLTGADGARALHGHGHGGGGASDLRWADIPKRRNFWLLGVCYLPVVALYGATQQNFTPIVVSHGFDPKVAGLLLSVFSISHVVSSILMGLASDRFGNKLPLAGLAIGAAIGGVLVGFGAALPVLLLGAVMIGFSGGLWTLLPAAASVEFGAGGVGRAFGALMLFIPINSATPALVAKVQEATGSYGPALLGLGAVSVVGGLLVLLMNEKRGGHPTAAETEAVIEDAVQPLV